MKIRPLSNKSTAFTLMEIMLVVTIIALLAAMLIGRSADFLAWGHEARVKGDISTMRTLLTMYRGVGGNYPSTSQGLKALVTRPDGEPRLEEYRFPTFERKVDNTVPVRKGAQWRRHDMTVVSN